MICSGSYYFVMFCNDSWCFVMVRHGSRHGSWCFSVMVSSWFIMVHCHGLSWFVMVHCHGSSWFTVMVSSWFVMVRDVLFSKILQKRSCDPQFSQSESQIHYQISFLMRLLFSPFHLKSIPLKSSAKNLINLDLIEMIQFCLKIYDL